MLPSPKKVNRHKFNLIIARAKQASDIDMTAFKITEVKSKISDLKEKIKELERTKAHHMKRIEAIDQEIANTNAKIANRQSDIESMQKKIEESGITPIQVSHPQSVTPLSFGVAPNNIIL